jgi:hypothetical protein
MSSVSFISVGCAVSTMMSSSLFIAMEPAVCAAKRQLQEYDQASNVYTDSDIGNANTSISVASCETVLDYLSNLMFNGNEQSRTRPEVLHCQ